MRKIKRFKVLNIQGFDKQIQRPAATPLYWMTQKWWEGQVGYSPKVDSDTQRFSIKFGMKLRIMSNQMYF